MHSLCQGWGVRGGTCRSGFCTSRVAYRTHLDGISDQFRKENLQKTCEVEWNTEIGEARKWKVSSYLGTCTKNIQLRWFQFRVCHRLLPTRKMLQIYGIINDNRCGFCRTEVETTLHLTVKCYKVRLFWDEVWRTFFRCNAQYRVLELTPAKIMFGDYSENNGLNLLLLLAKCFLSIVRAKGSHPCVCFLRTLKSLAFKCVRIK